MTVVGSALLGSTVDTCSASVLWWLWTNLHIFHVAADSNPEVLLSLLLQNGEPCPVDASGCSFTQRGSHLENWKYFYEFHAAAMRDEGQHFFGYLCQTQVPGCRFNP